MYAAEDLLLHTNAEVTLIDRLPVAGGLVRYGVAPDHPATKGAGETFARFHAHPRVRMTLGLEVGKDVTVEELAAHHDAVVYAVGAPSDRRLGIPGEELPGSVSATSVVSWYNAHPETPPDAVRLATERVVVVGNGNVALDVARVLVTDPAPWPARTSPTTPSPPSGTAGCARWCCSAAGAPGRLRTPAPNCSP